MNQSEYETLMMAHDNLQRELADIKRLMGKDKHELIKANIALNRRVQKLEDVNSQLERQAPGVELDLLNMELTDALKQNQRYREAIEKAMAECVKDKLYTVENILSKALEDEINDSERINKRTREI